MPLQVYVQNVPLSMPATPHVRLQMFANVRDWYSCNRRKNYIEIVLTLPSEWTKGKGLTTEKGLHPWQCLHTIPQD